MNENEIERLRLRFSGQLGVGKMQFLARKHVQSLDQLLESDDFGDRNKNHDILNPANCSRSLGRRGPKLHSLQRIASHEQKVAEVQKIESMVFKQQKRTKGVQIIGDVTYSKDLVKSRSTRSRETDATSHYTEDDSVQHESKKDRANQSIVGIRPEQNGVFVTDSRTQKAFNVDVESYHPTRTCLSFLSDNRAPRSKLSRGTSTQKVKNLVDTHEPPRTCMSFLDPPKDQKSCIFSPCGVPSKKTTNPRVRKTFKPNKGLNRDDCASPLLILEPEEKLRYSFVGNKNDWLSHTNPEKGETAIKRDYSYLKEEQKYEKDREVDRDEQLVSFPNEANCLRQGSFSHSLNCRQHPFLGPQDSWTSDETKEWGHKMEKITPPSSLPVQRRSQLILKQRTDPEQVNKNIDWLVNGADFSLLFSDNSPFSCRG